MLICLDGRLWVISDLGANGKTVLVERIGGYYQCTPFWDIQRQKYRYLDMYFTDQPGVKIYQKGAKRMRIRVTKLLALAGQNRFCWKTPEVREQMERANGNACDVRAWYGAIRDEADYRLPFIRERRGVVFMVTERDTFADRNDVQDLEGFPIEGNLFEDPAEVEYFRREQELRDYFQYPEGAFRSIRAA